MPEGDSIFRAARTLHQALAGRMVVHFESVYPQLTRVDHDRPLRGRTIQRVTPRGKHLLIWFSGDLVLHTHLRMNGSWHLYRPGERWMRGRHHMRILVATEEWEAVAFNVPIAEFVVGAGCEHIAPLSDLGPDLLAVDFDLDEAVRRLQALPGVQIGDALLDQHALAGIGNIFKSETLFACGISPFLDVGDLSHEALTRVASTARRLLQAHTSAQSPVTRRAVYGRGGMACRRCGTPIMRRAQGPDARSTYWCPQCQPER